MVRHRYGCPIKYLLKNKSTDLRAAWRRSIMVAHRSGPRCGSRNLRDRFDRVGAGCEALGVPKSVVVIDNYDSFTYNLVQYLQVLGAVCDVRLNDTTSAEDVERADPDGILLSPGPGTPDDAGVTLAVIERLAGKTPIL